MSSSILGTRDQKCPWLGNFNDLHLVLLGLWLYPSPLGGEETLYVCVWGGGNQSHFLDKSLGGYPSTLRKKGTKGDKSFLSSALVRKA